MSFDPTQRCEQHEVIQIEASANVNIDNAFVPIVTLKEQVSKGFEYRKSQETLRLDHHIIVSNPLNLEIIRFTGQENTIRLIFEVKKGNPKANDSDGGDITIHGTGVKVNPTKVNKKYDSTFDLEVSIEGSNKKRNIYFIANDDDWIFDGGVSNVFCGQILIEGVTVARGYYYIKDGTLLGRRGGDSDPTDVIVVKDLTQDEAKKLIKAINEGESRDNELVKSISAVGMKNEELNTRAFMSTLKQTEGHGESLPYNAKHGFVNGKLDVFTDESYENNPKDYKAHPYEGVAKGGTAAGAYQMLRPTFKSQLRNNSKVTDFGPISQDHAVIGIFSAEGIDALEYIKTGDLDKAVQKLIKDKWGNTQFASLPGGGQEKKGFTMADLKQMFKGNLANELNKKSNIAIPQGKLFD